MSIHQQVTIPASPRDVYAILADASALSALSGMDGKSGLAEGDEYTPFGGRVTGRQVELIPASRIVQVWRLPEWEPGRYTIVRFALEPAGDGTRLTLDQYGYPEETDTVGCHDTWHDHLSEGWGMFYLGPLARHFAER
jgi:activator of HSP90 ATPase